MTNTKCKNCGCSEIDVDPSRGDAVCTNCGVVLEDSIIVSEVQFEENTHGGSSALGQFVSSESKGGARGFGGTFHTGLGKESREITLKNARKAITNLAQQLRLNQHCIDTAFNFYKMALTRHLTRGRKNAHVIAACVYITCRTESTPHLLIDFSDVLQICVYELGRTYLRLSQALCINIPSMDPCLYILRFANRLEFGDKTHEVSMTALRLVQRMKRDCIHSGRRPSGLCGAALLMAARLHEFNRTVGDIIKIVKVHESTLKKRLIEFGETPSSSLTLDEFMTVDLEEEQDPPSFKAARKKDKERLAKMMEDENVDDSFNELQREIEMELEEKARGKKRPRNHISRDYDESDPETVDTNRFITQSTLGVIHGCLVNDGVVTTPGTTTHPSTSTGLGPNMATMGLSSSLNEQTVTTTEDTPSAPDSGEIDLMGIDEDEIDSYIMTEQESKNKDVLWMKINESYLRDKKEKEEKLAKEREEGKPEKKKRKPPKKKNSQPANSAGEAIEKMLQEKKISSKINYDVLKSLSVKPVDSFKPPPKDITTDSNSSASTLSADIPSEPSSSSDPVITSARMSRLGPRLDTEPRKPKTAPSIGLPLATSEEPKTTVPPVIEILPDQELEDDEEYEDEVEPENNDEVSLSQMLNQHRDDDYYGGYDEDEF